MRKDIDNNSRTLLMTDNIWSGHSIFFLAATLYIVITNDLKEKLERIRPTNLLITDITKKD